MDESEFYGSKLTIYGAVKYIGEGEDPENDVFFQIWKKALENIYGNK